MILLMFPLYLVSSALASPLTPLADKVDQHQPVLQSDTINNENLNSEKNTWFKPESSLEGSVPLKSSCVGSTKDATDATNLEGLDILGFLAKYGDYVIDTSSEPWKQLQQYYLDSLKNKSKTLNIDPSDFSTTDLYNSKANGFPSFSSSKLPSNDYIVSKKSPLQQSVSLDVSKEPTDATNLKVLDVTGFFAKYGDYIIGMSSKPFKELQQYLESQKNKSKSLNIEPSDFSTTNLYNSKANGFLSYSSPKLPSNDYIVSKKFPLQQSMSLDVSKKPTDATNLKVLDVTGFFAKYGDYIIGMSSKPFKELQQYLDSQKNKSKLLNIEPSDFSTTDLYNSKANGFSSFSSSKSPSNNNIVSKKSPLQQSMSLDVSKEPTDATNLKVLDVTGFFAKYGDYIIGMSSKPFKELQQYLDSQKNKSKSLNIEPSDFSTTDLYNSKANGFPSFSSPKLPSNDYIVSKKTPLQQSTSLGVSKEPTDDTNLKGLDITGFLAKYGDDVIDTSSEPWKQLQQYYLDSLKNKSQSSLSDS